MIILKLYTFIFQTFTKSGLGDITTLINSENVVTSENELINTVSGVNNFV